MSKFEQSSKPERIKPIIGLAQKAGKLKSGGFKAEESIESGRACVCLMASDASERTKKHFSEICRTGSVRVVELEFDKTELGHIIGRDPRSVLTVEDSGFAERILGLSVGR